MIWLYLALTAYLINAIVFIVDKYLLESPIPRPYSYAFGVSVLSLSALFLIPFGVTWLGWRYLLIALCSGAIFFVGLVSLYRTIRAGGISVVATQVGTFNAIFTAIFSTLILKEVLSFNNHLALVLLIIGLILVGRVKNHIFWGAIFSGVIFALSAVLLKLSFNLSDFVNGLFWTRVGFVGAAFASLLRHGSRKEVYSTFKKAPTNSKMIFVGNKIMAGVAALFLYVAVSLGSVSIVNSLLGFQFLFIFFLAIALNRKIPGLETELDRKNLLTRALGIVFIVTGFIILF